MKNSNLEFLKNILCEQDVVASLTTNFNALCKIIPEVKDMEQTDHKHPHHNDTVWEHTLKALSYSPNNFDIRLTLLLHDIGKPFVFFEGDDGVRHFWGHAEKSAEIAKRVLSELNVDTKYQEYICKLVITHDTKITEQMIEDDYNFCCTLYQVQLCDSLAHDPAHNQKRMNLMAQTKQIIDNYKTK